MAPPVTIATASSSLPNIHSSSDASACHPPSYSASHLSSRLPQRYGVMDNENRTEVLKIGRCPDASRNHPDPRRAALLAASLGAREHSRRPLRGLLRGARTAGRPRNRCPLPEG